MKAPLQRLPGPVEKQRYFKGQRLVNLRAVYRSGGKASFHVSTASSLNTRRERDTMSEREI